MWHFVIALHFTLEHTREIIESSTLDKPPGFRDWLWYAPAHLDKESQEFVASLGFLSSAFKFPQDQGLHFLGQLLFRMGFEVPYVKSDEADDDSDPGEAEEGGTMEDDDIQEIKRM